jgi:hypothetical protein
LESLEFNGNFDYLGNNVTSEGLKSLCEALQGHTSIRELDLSWNTICFGEYGLEPLAHLLKNNSTLKTL